MEDIIISLEPAFHRVERFILWHNRYASLVAFFIGHCLFYAIARAGLRPFCAVMLVVLMFHILDCLKHKRSQSTSNEEAQFCELTQLILRSYRYVLDTHEKLNTLKTENRAKYSIFIIIICLIFALIGIKVNGFYVSYLTMLILFTFPAIVYHKLIPKLLQRLAPILEQFDQSMQYERRSLVDPKELLVKFDKTRNIVTDEDDDDDVRRLKQQTKGQALPLLDEDEGNVDDDDDDVNEKRFIDTNDQSHTMLNFRQRYQNEPNFDMLSDSSSSAADDEMSRINDLYANVADQIDGKHRIKIKNDEFKIKGHRNKQRPKLTDAQFFKGTTANDGKITTHQTSITTELFNSGSSNPSNEPDFTSFDFLNDYDETNN